MIKSVETIAQVKRKLEESEEHNQVRRPFKLTEGRRLKVITSDQTDRLQEG